MASDNQKSTPKDLFLAIDIGGTKILATLVDASGMVLWREKCPSPREGGSEPLLKTLDETIAKLLAKAGNLAIEDLRAMGIAVPGMVDIDEGLVLKTPNMGLSNTPLGEHCRKKYGLPVAVGNDCNVGIRGEKWLGSARDAQSAFGILVGTGVGGGFVQGSEVWQGARNLAAEIGHIVMEINGPLCGCGNRGCLEALASRTAIERDLRDAIEARCQTLLTELLDDDTHVIRSSLLRQCVEADDRLVTETLCRAAEVLGYACLTVGHLLDPEVIVFGGGVIDACSSLMIPIIQRVVACDCLTDEGQKGRVLVSSLGDDAVILGAAAIARQEIGENPFKKRFAVAPSYDPIVRKKSGLFEIGPRSFDANFFVNASGKVKRTKVAPPALGDDGARRIGPQHLNRPCRSGPHVLFVSTGPKGDIQLSDEACLYLKQRLIEWRALPLAEALEAYNECAERKAVLVYVE